MKYAPARDTAIALLVLLASAGLLITGCPAGDSAQVGGGPVSAEIIVTSSEGPAPHIVTAFGDSSSSTAGAIATYAWDFDGLAQFTGPVATYTFEQPGGYDIFLTVTDTAGNQGTTFTRVRAYGDDPADAVIGADITSGPAPLTVVFDGTDSSAGADEIRDYYWDFGDGSVSRNTQPFHQYQAEGDYVVMLRVVSAGGMEDTAEITINVGSTEGTAAKSLQFDGTQYATLPVTGAGSLTACTFEAWVNAATDGGMVASIGAQALVIDVAPGSNEIRVRKDSDTVQATAPSLAGNWQHVAVTYDSAAGAAIYLNGQQLKTGALSGDISVSALTIGQGFEGKVSRVAFWSIARDANDIAASWSAAPSAASTGLLGYWPFDEGSGQTLTNRTGGDDGTLGMSAADEAADAAWSTDAP